MNTAIIFLTDKDVRTTDSFFRVRVRNDGYSLDAKRTPLAGSNDLDELSFIFSSLDEKNLSQYPNIAVVSVNHLDDVGKFSLSEDWSQPAGNTYVALHEIADLKNGNSITKATTIPGDVPVIAGGQSSPYTHGKSNYNGNVITVSKSGSAGYVGWHDYPIWASDCIAIQSKDETKYLNRYLYFCMKAKQEEIYLRQQGTGQPHIYISHIEDLPIPELPLAKQRAIIKKAQLTQQDLDEAKQTLKEKEDAISSLFTSIYYSDS